MNECPQIERTTGSNGSITPIEAEAPAGGSLGHSRRSHFDGGCAPWRRHSVESLELRLSAIMLSPQLCRVSLAWVDLGRATPRNAEALATRHWT